MQKVEKRKKSRNLRFTEIQLLIIPAVIAVLGSIMVISVPNKAVGWTATDLWIPLVFIGLLVVTHLALNIGLPKSDQVLLGLVSMLAAFGLIMTQRLETTRTGNIAVRQLIWIAIGYVFFIIITLGLRNLMLLKRYTYTFMFIGLGLTAAVAVFGAEINGARLWFRFGIFSFQPSELLKILLVIFLAGFLDDKRDLITETRFRLGPLPFPPLPYLAPLLVVWGISMLTLIVSKDLGAALLFFGVMLVLLYVASSRAGYVLAGLVLFGAGAYLAYLAFSHVEVRVAVWLNPWQYAQDIGYQIVQAIFALTNGGLFGEGLGYGSPGYIPEVQTDYVFAAIGEETGLIGSIGLICIYLLVIYRGFHIALNATNGFYQYLAIGLTSIIGIQTFIILGGVTKLIPLTGMTLPFVSYGGSSIIANFIIAALLIRISAEQRTG
jgi:cell division protein FtsW (lipid II flippase)